MTKPDSGEILIDSENINKNLDDWQNKIIYLSQKNYLFEDNILSNIVLGENERNIDKDRLEKALEISNFIKTKDEFPNGLNTLIGGNNFKISGGQQKKIQIARCFYQITNEKNYLFLMNLQIILMKSLKLFFNGLKKYKNDKTIILISHNSDDLKICDKIYDLEKKS